MSRLAFYPFAYALLDEHIYNYCWYCLKEKEAGVTMQECRTCRRAQFCGKRCRSLGWMDHKVECRGMRNILFRSSCDVRLLGRVVRRHMQITNGEHLKTNDFFLNRSSRRNLMELYDKKNALFDGIMTFFKFEVVYDHLRCLHVLNDAYILPIEQTFKIYSIIKVNQIDICNKLNGQPIAKGLYLDLSAYSHSCRPNAAFTTEGFIATLHPLVEGVNLADTKNTSISYIPLLLSKELRQQKLKQMFAFDCKCIRCLDENDHLLTAVRCPECSHSVTIYNSNDELKEDPLVCGNCSQELTFSVNDALKDIEFLKCMQIPLQRDGVLPTNVLLDIISAYEEKMARENVYLNCMYKAALKRTADCSIEKRLDYLLKCLPCLLICYPKNHVQLAHHYINIAVHQAGCNDYKSATSSLDEALRQFTVCVGTDHPMYKKCNVLRELNQRKIITTLDSN